MKGSQTPSPDAAAEIARLRAELEAIHRSRLWRTANLYWRARRGLGELRRRLASRRRQDASAGAPAAAPPVSQTTAPPSRPDPEATHGRQFQGMSSLPGRCNVCGETTAFYYKDPLLFRESLTCGVCKTTSRYRSIARGLLRAVDMLAGVRADSLAALGAAHGTRRISVLDTQVPFYFRGNAYPIPDMLARADWIDVSTSRYDRDEKPGSRLGKRTTNQNLEKLTFADAAFDVVVTSDVLEHVRLDDLAHREIRRVLRPGGVYLFTVPHFRNRETLERVRVVDPRDPSRDEFLLEPEYHGDANSEDGRALAYRAYGTDLDGRLRALGFDVDYTAEPIDSLGIRNTELFFCRVIEAPVAPPSSAS